MFSAPRFQNRKLVYQVSWSWKLDLANFVLEALFRTHVSVSFLGVFDTDSAIAAGTPAECSRIPDIYGWLISDCKNVKKGLIFGKGC